MTRFFPIIGWLKSYTKTDFNGDVFAGIITAILLVPQGIAYAMLAGLPPQLGLYASIIPPLVYALLGTSRTMSVGPVSIAAIMIASVLTSPDINALGNPVESAIILAAESGLILLAMAVLRMGGLVSFISHPVLTGFTSGASILIIFSQLPQLLGIPKRHCGINIECYQQSLQFFNVAAASLGLLSLTILILFNKPLISLLKKTGLSQAIIIGISKTAPLLVVVITTLLVSYYNLSNTENVAIVGAIKGGLPTLSLDFISSNKWSLLLPYSGFIALIAYIESVAIAKITANMRHQRIDPNQELIAIGFANLATAVSGGMSVAGGFSRTMVNFTAGARTQMAMLIAVVLLSFAVVFASDGFEFIPKATLAAIILMAIFPLIKLGHIIKTWRYDRGDGMVEIVTLLGVLILGIEEGLMLGIVLTIANYLRQISHPHIAEVGLVEGSEHYRNTQRHKVKTWSNLILLRIDENITFTNADYVSDFILERLKNRQVKHVVLIFTSVSYIDSTALEALEATAHSIQQQGINLHLSEVKGPVMDKLKLTFFLERLKSGQVFFQTADAVKALT
ncbi:MAG: SulP family inorganic anion transporter [Methylococcales bacterium]|nr:SulP family inorganic anion transporter [Methylococcales bacterium]